MKKIIVSVLSLVFVLFLLPNVGHADAKHSVSLFLNGKQLDADVPPQVVGAGTTMVPLRLITEALGSKVSWTGNDRPITVEKNGLRIELQIGKTIATVGETSVPLEAAPILVDNNTMLPIRFLAERFGLTVGWDQAAQAVQLTEKPTPVTGLPVSGGQISTAPAPAPTPTGKPTASSNPTSVGGAAVSPAPTPIGKPTVSPAPTSSNPATATQANNTVGVNPLPAPTATAPALPSPPAYNAKYPEIWSIGLTKDGLSIRATGPIIPTFFTLSNPDRLVIDIPGADLTKSMINGSVGQTGELTVNDPNISKIRYSHFSDDPMKVRIVVDLKGKIDYNLIDSKNPLELLVAIGHPPSTGKKFKVVVDAGHGGHDSGAISINGLMEKNFTLSLATKVYQLLLKETQIQPIMTRNDDTFIELDKRVDIANSQNADIFVSIHGNKYDKPSIDGTETYYNRPDSEGLADVLHKDILLATGFDDRGVRTADYRVIKKTTMPAVLCEIGFLSNPNNEASMYLSIFQDKVAASIVQGIKSYLQIK